MQTDVLCKETIDQMVQYLHPLKLVIDPFSGLGVYEPVFDNVRIPEQATFESDPSKSKRKSRR